QTLSRWHGRLSVRELGQRPTSAGSACPGSPGPSRTGEEIRVLAYIPVDDRLGHSYLYYERSGQMFQVFLQITFRRSLEDFSVLKEEILRQILTSRVAFYDANRASATIRSRNGVRRDHKIKGIECDFGTTRR